MIYINQSVLQALKESFADLLNWEFLGRKMLPNNYACECRDKKGEQKDLFKLFN